MSSLNLAKALHLYSNVTVLSCWQKLAFCPAHGELRARCFYCPSAWKEKKNRSERDTSDVVPLCRYRYVDYVGVDFLYSHIQLYSYSYGYCYCLRCEQSFKLYYPQDQRTLYILRLVLQRKRILESHVMNLGCLHVLCFGLLGFERNKVVHG